jgi:hypothetical protein
MLVGNLQRVSYAKLIIDRDRYSIKVAKANVNCTNNGLVECLSLRIRIAQEVSNIRGVIQRYVV